jgi:hypothetical protein
VINMRCLIVTMDASVIIGKGGRHIAEIRVSRVFLVPFLFLSLHSQLFYDRFEIRKENEGADRDCPFACLRTSDRAKPTPASTSPNPSLETPSGSSAFKELSTRLPRSVPPRSCSSSVITPFRTFCTDLARSTRFAIRDWQAFGLIVRRINDENFGEPSMPGSRPVTIKFMIPNSRMGSV